MARCPFNCHFIDAVQCRGNLLAFSASALILNCP
jgi:hypothetical protein